MKNFNFICRRNKTIYSERKIEEEYADEKKIVIKIKVENLFN